MSEGVWSAGLSEVHSGLAESLQKCTYPFNHHSLYILALTGPNIIFDTKINIYYPIYIYIMQTFSFTIYEHLKKFF